MLDRPTPGQSALCAEYAAPLPVGALVLGKSAVDAAALLPRVFNLCRAAQGAAARLAFGLPLDGDEAEEVRLEILREHLIKFCLKFPAHFGIGPMPFPEGWQQGTREAREVLFGAAGCLPASKSAFVDFLEAGQGVAPVLRRIRDCFAPGEACCDPLPDVTASNALRVMALENSVAGRQAGNPVMREIEASFGRGPLWRATARAYDAQDCLAAALPDIASAQPGLAIVTAARGTYAISASVEDGVVTDFRRVTPTDHLLARGGIMEQTLASLPSNKVGMAPLVLDILDPCSPVRLREVGHA